MFYTKRCYAKNNPFTCRTLRVGSLLDYRESLQQGVGDALEGIIQNNIELDGHISNADFNAAFKAHGPGSSFFVEKMEIQPNVGRGVSYVSGRGQVEVKIPNKFIFCLTRSDEPVGAPSEFEYDDFWYLEEKDLNQFASKLGRAVFDAVKRLEAEGTAVFGSAVDANELTYEVEVKDVTYTDAPFVTNNGNVRHVYDYFKARLTAICSTKDHIFEPQRETRIILTFFIDGAEIYPTIKSIICDEIDPAVFRMMSGEADHRGDDRESLG